MTCCCCIHVMPSNELQRKDSLMQKNVRPLAPSASPFLSLDCFCSSLMLSYAFLLRCQQHSSPHLVFHCLWSWVQRRKLISLHDIKRITYWISSSSPKKIKNQPVFFVAIKSVAGFCAVIRNVPGMIIQVQMYHCIANKKWIKYKMLQVKTKQKQIGSGSIDNNLTSLTTVKNNLYFLNPTNK